MVSKEVIFNSFYFGRVLLVLKELIFNSSFILGGCGGLKRSDLYLEGVMVLKELIYNSSFSGRVKWSQRK